MNAEQQAAYDRIIEFIEGDESFFGLFGFAGTGKSFLTRHISKKCSESNIKICGISPTHKARKILEAFLNKDSFIPVPTMTVAKFLLKQRQHSYTGTKNFRGNDSENAKHFDLFIIDECSMISDRDVEAVMKNIKMAKKKALFIGDPCQIPNPVQKFEWNDDGTISKKDSKSFKVDHVTLCEIVRQKDASSIVEISKLFRDDILEEKEIPRENTKDIRFYSESDRFYSRIERVLNRDNYLFTKIVTYTNRSVRAYNKFARDILGFTGKFVVGDLLMGYTNIGWPEPFIENGEEYVVKSVDEVTQIIDGFSCRGHAVTIEARHSFQYASIFFPFLTGEGNVKMLKKLQALAKKNNEPGSTKEDFKKYRRLKDQVMFLEDIYDYNGEIVTADALRDRHPKLFKSVDNYIDPKTRKAYETRDDFNKAYGGIVDMRINDNKQISENEKFADRFLVIDMDISYGYAITCHKAQGSTYLNVFVDERNFEKLGDMWNDRYKAYVNSTKEKNQLKYVAYTRASEKMWVLYKK